MAAWTRQTVCPTARTIASQNAGTSSHLRAVITAWGALPECIAGNERDVASLCRSAPPNVAIAIGHNDMARGP